MTYTIHNPKQVTSCIYPEQSDFTGVVKDNKGNICYYENGKIHRENHPALIYNNGIVAYYKHSKIHSEYGPAIIYADGEKEYWLNDNRINIHTDEELKDYLILRIFE